MGRAFFFRGGMGGSIFVGGEVKNFGVAQNFFVCKISPKNFPPAADSMFYLIYLKTFPPVAGQNVWGGSIIPLQQGAFFCKISRCLFFQRRPKFFVQGAIFFRWKFFTQGMPRKRARSIHSVCMLLFAIAPQGKNFSDIIREFAYNFNCSVVTSSM